MYQSVQYMASFFIFPNEECSDLEMLELLPRNKIYLGELVNFRGKVFHRIEPTADHPYHFDCAVADIYAGKTLYWDANEDKHINTECHFYFKEDRFGVPESSLITIVSAGSGWYDRANHTIETASDAIESANEHEEVSPVMSYQDFAKLWTAYVNAVKKMLCEDFGRIGKQSLYCFCSIEDYSWEYAHKCLHYTADDMNLCARIRYVLEKAKCLEEYFDYCTLSGRQADMELVTWWLNDISKP